MRGRFRRDARSVTSPGVIFKTRHAFLAELDVRGLFSGRLRLCIINSFRSQVNGIGLSDLKGSVVLSRRQRSETRLRVALFANQRGACRNGRSPFSNFTGVAARSFAIWGSGMTDETERR